METLDEHMEKILDARSHVMKRMGERRGVDSAQ